MGGPLCGRCQGGSGVAGFHCCIAPPPTLFHEFSAIRCHVILHPGDWEGVIQCRNRWFARPRAATPGLSNTSTIRAGTHACPLAEWMRRWGLQTGARAAVACQMLPSFMVSLRDTPLLSAGRASDATNRCPRCSRVDSEPAEEGASRRSRLCPATDTYPIAIALHLR